MERMYTYRVATHLLGKAKGYVSAEGVPLALQFNAPPEFNGERGKWTPETLLVASVATCLAATFRAVAEASKFDYMNFHVDGQGVLEKLEDGFRFTRIVLRPRIGVIQDEDRERAAKLLLKAERACLIARSLRCEVILEPVVVVAAADDIALPVPAY